MSMGQRQVWDKVLDFTVQDYVTREVYFQIKYAKDVTIDEKYEKTELKGGCDNQILYTSYHSPTANFTATLPLIDDNVIAVKTGAVVKKGAQKNSYDKIYTVDTTAGTVTMEVTPLTGTLKVYNVDSDENLGTEIAAVASNPTLEQYSITGKVLTFNTAKKGNQVLIVCDYTTGANAKGVIFVSGKLPKYIRITAKTKSVDQSGNVAYKNVLIEKAKPSPDFEFKTAAGTPAELPFACEVFGWLNEDGDSQFHRIVTDEDLII